MQESNLATGAIKMLPSSNCFLSWRCSTCLSIAIFSAGASIERFECCNGYLVALFVFVFFQSWYIMLEAHSRVSEGVNFSMRLYYAWLHALRVTQRKENRDYFYESNF